jgi:hypothetical protein
MPLVDTVIKFWRGEGVAFRAVAASDYATQSNGYVSNGSQGEGADIAMWSKLLRQRFRYPRDAAFNNRDRYSSA